MKTPIVKFAIALLIAVAATHAQADIFIRVAPPPLPYYEQPVVPADGYLWTPGYWAWDDSDGDYFWVPGTWVLAPEPGYLWTPGYWAWDDIGYGYGWRPGYWGPRVGYYGGVNYGYGYYGSGYAGGRWYGNRFSYNRAVNNVNVVYIHNTYNATVINRSDNRTSYNGGDGGLHARPRPEDERADHERHLAWTDSQNRHQDEARHDRGQFASINQGRPQIGATPRPSDFRHPDSTPVGGDASHRALPGDDRRPFAGNNPPSDRRDDSRAAEQHQPPRGWPQSEREFRSPQQLGRSENGLPHERPEQRLNSQPGRPPPPPHSNGQMPRSAPPSAPEPRAAGPRFEGRPGDDRGPIAAKPAQPAEARPSPRSPQAGQRGRELN